MSDILTKLQDSVSSLTRRAANLSNACQKAAFEAGRVVAQASFAARVADKLGGEYANTAQEKLTAAQTAVNELTGLITEEENAPAATDW